jgi:hypothetical protein
MNKTFTQRVTDALNLAKLHAAPFQPSRAEIEEQLRRVVAEVERMDDPEAYVRATFRPGTWDAVAIEMLRRSSAGGRQ